MRKPDSFGTEPAGHPAASLAGNAAAGAGPAADALLQQLPWGVVVLDAHGTVLRLNQQAAAWWGMPPQDVAGKPLGEATTSTLPADLQLALQRVPSSPEPLPGEFFLPRHQQWIAMTSARQGDDWVVYWQDITAQKQLEARTLTRQAASDALLRRTEAVARTGSYELELATGHFHFSDGLFQLFGEEPGAFVPDMALIEARSHPDDSAVVQQVLAQAIDHRQPYYYQRRIYRPDGQLRTLECHGRVECNALGEPVKLLGLVQDVTEREQAAQELLRMKDELAQRAADNYLALYNSMDEGFCIVEVLFDAAQHPTDYRFLDVNPAFEKHTALYGAVGKTIRELVPSIEPHWADVYGRVAWSGEALRFEANVESMSRWFDINAFPIGPLPAQHVGVLFTDITERKQQEQQQAFLLRFSDALRAETSATSVAYRALEMLCEQLQLDRCYIGIYDLAEDRGIFPHQVGNHRIPSLPAEVRLSDFPDALRVAYDRTLRIDDLAQTEGLSDTDRQNLGALGLRALVAATLRRGAARPQWAIIALSADVRHWTPGEVALLEEATERTWAAMERAQAATTLQEAHAQLVSVLESTSDAFYDLDAELRFTYINRPAAQLWGREPSDLLGQRYWQAFPQVVGSEAYHRHAEVQQTGQPAHFETVSPVLGTWLDVSIYPGRRGGLSVFFRDISARKLAEEALRASQATLAAVFEALPVGVGVLDRQGQLTLANRRMQQYLPTGRMPSQDATQYAHWRAYHPDGRPLAPSEFPGARALRGETVVPGIEMRYTPEEGPAVWTQVFSVPLPDERGQVSGQVTVILDITDHKTAEEALRVSEAKYRTLFETMDQGFGVGEVLLAEPGRPADFRWLQVNPQVERLTGMPQAALLSGQTMRAVIPQLEGIWYERYERVALTGQSVRFEEHAQVLGRWLDVYAYPLEPEGPAPHRVALLFTNITARKQAAENLRQAEERHREQLEQQVAERTHQMQESRHLLQTVFDASPTAIVVMRILHDAAGQAEDFEILLYNEFNRQVVGRDDLVGQRFSAMFPQTVPTGILARLLDVATTGEPADFEQWYAGEGIRHWFRHIFVRQDGLLVMTSEVVTDRKRLEQAQDRSLALLLQTESVASMGSWEYDLRTHEFFWSDGLYHLLERPVGSTLTLQVFLDAVLDDDRPAATHLLRTLTTGAAAFDTTLRLRIGEAVKTVRFKAVPLPSGPPPPERVLGVCLDVSDVQRLEAENLALKLDRHKELLLAILQAQETERQRLGEVLHNGLGQVLYATKLHLDQLDTPGLHALADLSKLYRKTGRLLADAMRQTRTLAHELVPTSLLQYGLEAAVRDVCRDLSTPQLLIECQMWEEEQVLPQPVQATLFRLVQELAHNIVRHAGATQAIIELEVLPGGVSLRAEDNGHGFDPKAAADGLGLRTVRDAVGLLGGTVAIDSSPAFGTHIRLRIPFPLFS